MPKKTAKSTTDIFVSITYSINDDFNVGHAIMFQVNNYCYYVVIKMVILQIIYLL